MDHPISRQRALGEFLRKHREAAAPVGLHGDSGRRRRTPGLRREEAAEMAGISSTWYARLEQGKEITPSGPALARIADVFRLESAERAYLFHLAGRVDPAAGAAEDEPVVRTIETCVHACSYPAYVLDKYWNPRFWNAETAKIFTMWLQGPELNLLRHMFIDPGARTFVVDWELRARELLAQFRVDFGQHIDDPKMLDLVHGLNEESEWFRLFWNDQQAQLRYCIEKGYDHPQLGLLRFSQTTFMASAVPSLKLVILTPHS